MPIFSKDSEPIDLFAVTKQGNVELLLKGIKSRIKAAKRDGALPQGSDAGALISAEINEGWTLLMWACLHGKFSCVQALLENGVSVDQERPDGCNALLIAADRGFADCCRLLLERCVPNPRGYRHMGPFVGSGGRMSITSGKWGTLR